LDSCRGASTKARISLHKSELEHSITSPLHMAYMPSRENNPLGKRLPSAKPKDRSLHKPHLPLTMSCGQDAFVGGQLHSSRASKSPTLLAAGARGHGAARHTAPSH